MDLGLRDKVVLVAGSTRGIGLATARAFAAEGSRVVITGRDPGRLAEARSSLADYERVLAFDGDLRSQTVIDALMVRIDELWGRLDCLVANIGTGRGPGGWDVQESDWQRLLEENLSSSYRMAQAVLPVMQRTGAGSIVLVASIAGVESTPAPLPYGAAKAALISYGANLARQVASFNVRVNTIAPGNILFPGGSWERHLAERRDEVMRQIEADVPLRRFGQPEEIADVIVFLSSDRAAFITGSCVVVDGGQTRGT